jgi:6-phosphogluconolactonase
VTKQPPLSRRDFVATTTLGVIGLLGSTSALSRFAKGSDMLTLYVGTYTSADRFEGIHVLRMDSTSGALQQVSAVDAGPNPAFLTIHPSGNTLYAVNDAVAKPGIETGVVVSFKIDPASGALTSLNDASSEGTGPCYVSTDRKGRLALVANYATGTVTVIPIDDTGALGNPTYVAQHRGTGPVTARQDRAHAHCIVAHPSNRFVLAADLGSDAVLVYRLDEERKALVHLEQADGGMPPGTGPRHLVFHPQLPLVFVVGELNSTVTALRCDPATGVLSSVQTLSTLPSGASGANFPADIHVSPDGRSLYVSNRGHNSIAVYSVAADRGTLALQQHVPTGGDWPRNFTIDPTGRWLLVANQRSGSIIVLARDPGTGRLTPTSQRIDVPNPTCVRFQSSSSWT